MYLNKSILRMPQEKSTKPGPGTPVYTKVIQFMSDCEVPANTGISLPPFTDIDGYRHINLFLQFSQDASNDALLIIGAAFAFDKNGKLRTRRYINLEQIGSEPPITFLGVNVPGTSQGGAQNGGSYVARFPMLGPFIEVYVTNMATISRKVSVWGYLVS
jgi:hypothetical protein